MSELQSIAEAVAMRAGWRRPEADDSGAYVFRLRSGLVMEMFTPDRATLILKGDLGELAPDDDGAAMELARFAVGRMKERKSLLSITPEASPARVELSRSLGLAAFAQARNQEALFTEVRDFLNDLTWWNNRVAALRESSAGVSRAGAFAANMFRL